MFNCASPLREPVLRLYRELPVWLGSDLWVLGSRTEEFAGPLGNSVPLMMGNPEEAGGRGNCLCEMCSGRPALSVTCNIRGKGGRSRAAEQSTDSLPFKFS